MRRITTSTRRLTSTAPRTSARSCSNPRSGRPERLDTLGYTAQPTLR